MTATHTVDSAAQLLGHAAAWLYRAEDAGSMMARHALEQAAEGLEQAAEQIPLDVVGLALTLRAYHLADRCYAACETIGHPNLAGLFDAVTALADDEAASRRVTA